LSSSPRFKFGKRFQESIGEKMFERFDEIYKNRHDYAREWNKRTGGKVIGYF